MIKSAVISPCGKYRYELERTWDISKPKAMFLMLNPSTADSDNDDPTIRRCINFAKSWGYGGILVGNLFAYRSTEPKALLTVDNPIGDENLIHLEKMASKCEIVVCAWGNAPITNRLAEKLNGSYKPLRLFECLFCLDQSPDYTPKHPLYLKSELKPIPSRLAILSISDRLIKENGREGAVKIVKEKMESATIHLIKQYYYYLYEFLNINLL